MSKRRPITIERIQQIESPVGRTIARLGLALVSPFIALAMAFLAPFLIWYETSPKRLDPEPERPPPKPDIVVVRADELRPGDVLVKGASGEGTASSLGSVRQPPVPIWIIDEVRVYDTAKGKVGLVQASIFAPKSYGRHTMDLFHETPVVIHTRPQPETGGEHGQV